MHIVLFTQFYRNPDCPSAARHYSLLRRLARAHEVTLVTTNAWHERRLTERFDWVPPGVRLRMADVPYSNAMGPRQRLRAYLAFAARAFWTGLRLPAPDVFLGVSTPLTTAAATAAAARLRGVPWIFEVHDLWPDFPIQMGAISNAWTKALLYRLEHSLYRQAAHVVTLSPDMERHVRQYRSEGVTTVAYGSDLKLLENTDESTATSLWQDHGLDGRFVVLYAGSFGRANDIPTLLAAARQLEGRSDLCFAFTGQGYHLPDVKAAAQRFSNVRLLPPQPHWRTLALFRRADLSLVPFIDRPVLAANAPAKFYDSLAAGTPVVVTNPGWTKAFVEEHRCGWYVPPSRPDALTQRITRIVDRPEERSAAGARAREAARTHFDRALHVDALMTIIERVGS